MENVTTGDVSLPLNCGLLPTRPNKVTLLMAIDESQKEQFKYRLSNLKRSRFEHTHTKNNLLFSIRLGGSAVQYPARLVLLIPFKLFTNVLANCGLRIKLNILSANRNS